MTLSFKRILQIVGLGITAVLLVVAILVATPYVQPVLKKWLTHGEGTEPAEATEAKPSHELVRDARNRPVKPYTLRLSAETVQGLQVAVGPVTKACKLALPPQIGTLAYDTDHLYAVRPRFQGEVVEMGQYPPDGAARETFPKVLLRRPLGPGDVVKQGETLAVLWSKELGDRKVALVSALLDLWVDEETLQRQETIYLGGSLPEATYRASKAKVEKDLATVQAAEAGLRIAQLTADDVEAVRKDARIIQKRIQGKPETAEQRRERLNAEGKKWARVEVKVPMLRDNPTAKLVIVEKNTNINDIVDPSRDTPLYRLADLRWLLIYVNFNEEYLPLLQPLLQEHDTTAMHWKIRLEGEQDFPVIDLPILRIAPSLDPTQHSAVVIGRIPNPIKVPDQSRHLIVGQFVTATVEVSPGPGVAAIPTNALNEVDGESLVFVQRDPTRPEYTIRRVAVVRRSWNVTQVRSVLSAAEEKTAKEDVKLGRRPIETIQPGERVVIHGVTEMTDALEALVAKSRSEK